MKHPKDADLVAHDVLPIFIVGRHDAPTRPLAFVGSSFLISQSILITCHHCVKTELKPDEVYAAVHIKDDGSQEAAFLENITPHPEGFDLISANVPLAPTLGFELASDVAVTGSDVFSYGYPLTSTEQDADGEVLFVLNPRYLQGYVTRRFIYPHEGYPPTPVYELDMPAPGGLSGAPLVVTKTRRVVGVVFGTNDVGTIEEFSSVDPETRQRTPEVQRITSFALAHHTSSLNSLLEPESGRPLGEYLRG